MQLFGCDMTDGRFEDGVKMVKDDVKMDGYIYIYIYLSNRVYNDIYYLYGRCLLVSVNILNLLLATMRDSIVRMCWVFRLVG